MDIAAYLFQQTMSRLNNKFANSAELGYGHVVDSCTPVFYYLNLIRLPNLSGWRPIKVIIIPRK